MNSLGGISPRRGWFQRTSASTPSDPAGRDDRRSVGSRGRAGRCRSRRAARRRPRGGGSAFSCISGTNRSKRALPLLLGHVHRQVGVAEQPLGGVDAGATDGDADAGVDGDLVAADPERFAKASWTRSATASAASETSAPSRSTANSSPPKRATVSPDFEDRHQPCRDRDEELVAGGVPEAVVDELEVVEVEEQHGDLARRRAARLKAWSTRSWNSDLLGRPVSVSWSAWRRSSDVEGLALGDVAHRQDESVDAGVAAQVGGDDLHVAQRAVAAAHAPLDRRRDTRRWRAGQRADARRRRRGGRRSADRAVSAELSPEHALGRRCLVPDATSVVDAR